MSWFSKHVLHNGGAALTAAGAVIVAQVAHQLATDPTQIMTPAFGFKLAAPTLVAVWQAATAPVIPTSANGLKTTVDDGTPEGGVIVHAPDAPAGGDALQSAPPRPLPGPDDGGI